MSNYGELESLVTQETGWVAMKRLVLGYLGEKGWQLETYVNSFGVIKALLLQCLKLEKRRQGEVLAVITVNKSGLFAVARQVPDDAPLTALLSWLGRTNPPGVYKIILVREE